MYHNFIKDNTSYMMRISVKMPYQRTTEYEEKQKFLKALVSAMIM